MRKTRGKMISQADKQEWMLGLCALILTTLVVINQKGEYLAAETKASKTKYVVVVDPGHGGKDPGKIAADGQTEKDLNLQVAKIVKKELEKKGVDVMLTRSKDTTATGKEDSGKGEDMNARIDMINQELVDLCVSIHMNSYPTENVSGAQVFYYTNSEEGKALAKIIQDQLIRTADPTNTRQEKGDKSYYILVHSSCPTVIVECGFLSCPAEEEKLKNQEYQIKLAKAICQGVLDYFSP